MDELKAISERKISEKDRIRLLDSVKDLEHAGRNIQAAQKAHDMLSELYIERYKLGPQDQIRYQDGVIMSPEKKEEVTPEVK